MPAAGAGAIWRGPRGLTKGSLSARCWIMGCSVGRRDNKARAVCLMVSVALILGVDALPCALSVGLSMLGWSCVPGIPADSVAAVGAAVIVGGRGDGHDDAIRDLAARRIPVVAVGSLRQPLPLIAAVHGGAAEVVDMDLPYADLVRAVARSLAPRAAGVGLEERRGALLAALRDRDREQRLLGQLTPREQHVLRALAAGHSAGEIAAAERLGLATIRSHIQSVLRKLEVSSQLAAVAIGRRGWREVNVADQVI